MDEMKGKKILVFGSGISGESAARLLLKSGSEVILYDGNEKLDPREIQKKIAGTADHLESNMADWSRRLQIVLGEFPEQLLGHLDLLSLIHI